MTILVAGGSGLVGSAIVRELKRLNQDVVGISSKDVDLLNRNKTFEFIKNIKPKRPISEQKQEHYSHIKKLFSSS